MAFYVAAPFTSFDLTLASGKQIVIEERPAQELTHVQGQQVAPEGIAVWNPGFDVTPAALITGGIITERGVILPSVRGEEGAVFFDVAGFLQGEGEGAHRCVRTPCMLMWAFTPMVCLHLDILWHKTDLNH